MALYELLTAMMYARLLGERAAQNAARIYWRVTSTRTEWHEPEVGGPAWSFCPSPVPMASYVIGPDGEFWPPDNQRRQPNRRPAFDPPRGQGHTGLSPNLRGPIGQNAPALPALSRPRRTVLPGGCVLLRPDFGRKPDGFPPPAPAAMMAEAA